MKHTTIRLLGPFEVTIDAVAVTTFGYAKVRALLAYLAVERRHAHSRAELATLLWPDQTERAARASLSQALTTLRNALDDKSSDEPLILADAQSVQLNPALHIDLDVAQFLEHLQATQSHEHHSWRTCPTCSEQLQRALELYRGNFLSDLPIPDSDVFEGWASLQREHAQQRALSALERVLERLQWVGNYVGALQYAQRLVAFEPLLETHQRSYMRLLALNGEYTAAVAHYRQFQTLLDEELGAQPEDETTELFDQLRRGDTSDLEPEHAPFSVPAPPTAIVNRSSEIEALCRQLRDPKVRAVTITGTGGIGKTRLSLEIAHALRYDFEDGVYFVELAAINEAGLVANVIAQALGVKERPRQSMQVTLRDHLRTKQLLLVLDNFEHVVSAAALVSQLLASAPSLTVLVTSRSALTIRAEHQFHLEPLDDVAAVQLFRERISANHSLPGAGNDDPEVYAAICQKLDGLPLAIELVAVRARSLAPHELLRQLERPLQTLVRGPRDMPVRHQALRNTIQWSYELLNAEEQQAFDLLGIFAGGWTTDAAQALLGESVAALPILESLHQANLLQQQIVAGETRFMMLETIREFALEQLAKHDDVKASYVNYVAYYASFSATVNAELLRSEAIRWQARTHAEQDNIRHAFRRALEVGAYSAALEIATGVWRFHFMSGQLREGLERLEAALVYRQYAPPDVQSQALRAAGILEGAFNNFDQARRWLEESIEVARRAHDELNAQRTLTNLASVLLQQGELELARLALEESIALAHQFDDTKSVKFPIGFLATVHRRLGNYAEALALIEECLRLNRLYQDPEGIANGLLTQALILRDQGDCLRAQQVAEDALARHRALNHQLGMGWDYSLLGDIRQAEGDALEALALYRRCLSLWRERANVVNSAVVFDSVARVLAQHGYPHRAAMLLAASASIREHAAARLSPLEQQAWDEVRRTCEAALGEQAFADAWRDGWALTLAQAIDLASQPITPFEQQPCSPTLPSCFRPTNERWLLLQHHLIRDSVA